ncbi:NAD-dependent epimerase/dehydratase family protein [Chitinophaga oryzae]|uniref:NAD-dependent epimerase/dehydratase family protein n=1 Tax=Chitinophaga oryzae TaxID=2725414 RepID=UPI001C65D6A7|nr:NAD-dependent epimerase/dehydratase family protein [Chitinophaga oryzae]
MDTRMWEEQFPVIMRNVINACKKHHTKLVFFDNTYMYPQNAQVLTEQTPFAPVGRKGMERKVMAEMLLSEMNAGQITAVICRAPEFYGPGKTQSITNIFIFDAVRQHKTKSVAPRRCVKNFDLDA